MKKTLKDYQGRALKNLEKIKGGGNPVIDRDKVRRPKPGKEKLSVLIKMSPDCSGLFKI